MKKIIIGIPAFNEEANIRELLNDLLTQNIKDFVIETVLVNSDASTDKTVEYVRSIKDPRIRVIDNKERKGQGIRQNYVFEQKGYDIYILINADIRILDKDFISKLIEPILYGEADITSPSPREAAPVSFLEKILTTGNRIKRAAFENYKNGDNWYNCHGAVRAFSAALADKLRFKGSLSEDLYSYLFSKKHGFKFVFIKGLECLYAIPTTLNDHYKQNIRFFRLPELFFKEFGDDFVVENTKWPILLLAKRGIIEFLSHPVSATLYATLFFYNFMKCKILNREVSNTWSMSDTTRKVRI